MPRIGSDRDGEDALPRTIPELPSDWEATRQTLHAWARAVGEVARAHIPPQRHWWHIALEPTDAGLRSRPIPSPDGTAIRLELDLTRHQLVVVAGSDEVVRFDLASGGGRDDAEALLSTLDLLGLPRRYEDGRLLDGGAGYDPSHAEVLQRALKVVSGLFAEHRATLDGDVGPIQFWPHGFDLAFEWFGPRMVENEETGEEAPVQINLGWVPVPDAYFYSNPWPFDPELTRHPLPHGAVWHTNGWTGTRLGHDLVAGAASGGDRLIEYAAAVHRIAAPTLS